MTNGAADHLTRRLTRTVAVVTLLVLVAGANVTTTASGDAIPTWPWGWFGDGAPAAIEMTHRVVAGLLVALSLVLVFVAWRTKSPGLRRVAAGALVFVVLQAVLGGVRIYFPLGLVKVAHATLGQLFFCLTVAAVAMTSDWWHETTERPLDETALALLRAAGLTFLLLVVQLVLGALGRHDIVPREVHAVFALLPLLFTARLVLTASGDVPRDVELLRGPSALLGFLAALQLALGIASYIATSETPDPLQREVTSVVTLNAHLAVGAAMLGTTLSIILRTVRLWGVPTDERVAAAIRLREGAP